MADYQYLCKEKAKQLIETLNVDAPGANVELIFDWVIFAVFNFGPGLAIWVFFACPRRSAEPC